MTIKDELLKICRTPYHIDEIHPLDTDSPTVSLKEFRQARMKKVFSCFALFTCFAIIILSLLRLLTLWAGYFSEDNGMSLIEFGRNQAGSKTLLFCCIIIAMSFFALPSLLAFSESGLTILTYKRQIAQGDVEGQNCTQEEFEQAKNFIATHVRSMMVADVVALKNAPGVQDWARLFLHQEIVRR